MTILKTLVNGKQYHTAVIDGVVVVKKFDDEVIPVVEPIMKAWHKVAKFQKTGFTKKPTKKERLLAACVSCTPQAGAWLFTIRLGSTKYSVYTKR